LSLVHCELLREEGYSGKIELTLKDETNRKQNNVKECMYTRNDKNMKVMIILVNDVIA